VYLFTKRVTKRIVVIIEAHHFYQLHTKFYLAFLRLTPYAEEMIGDHQCGFQHNRSTTDRIFSIYEILEKKWEYNEAVHQLFIDFNKTNDSEEGGPVCYCH
jgi:hypothetical protein